MHDPLSKGLLLALAVSLAVLGMAWFALTLEAHWQQVRAADGPPASAARRLRMLGALALAASLVVCLRADHPTMAVLVWVMSLAGGALAVAMVLATWPTLLRPLVLWRSAPLG